MAGNQKSQDVDILSVRKIYVKGDNNTTLAANSILATDGKGGTVWVDMSTIRDGITFNTFATSQSTFTSGIYSSKFEILDSETAGLLPSDNGNSVSIYAKAFNQVNVAGQEPVYSFDTYTGNIKAGLEFVGSGILNISTDTIQNQVIFDSPDNASSSMSTMLSNISSVNSTLTGSINSFTSPFSSFIYQAISSYTTMAQLNMETLNVSTVNVIGYRQPFIQYGLVTLETTGTYTINLLTTYVDTNYVVQLTYLGSNYTKPLSSYNMTTSNFVASGNNNGYIQWTTYGNLF
jgi:hypothetical protein